MTRPVYLDYNSTTPTDPRVVEAMRQSELVDFGNPASQHVHGKAAKDAVDEARRRIALLLPDQVSEIVFTSGATESNNLALLGLANHGRRSGRLHILASAIEHPSVLGPLAVLSRQGFEVELLPVNGVGCVDPDEVHARLRPGTLIVSMMHANNETGVLQPVLEVAQIIAGSSALFHVDAAQTFGKEVLELMALRCDFLSLSGHKILVPKGIGALCIGPGIRHKASLSPVMYGGGQEAGLRPGTLPVPLIVGLGKAAELAFIEHVDRENEAVRVRREFMSHIGAVDHVINGDDGRIQKHVLNVSFAEVDSEALMLALRDSVAISRGAACSSGTRKPSYVLTAMGLPPDRIASSVRFSWGPGVGEIPYGRIVAAIRELSNARL